MDQERRGRAEDMAGREQAHQSGGYGGRGVGANPGDEVGEPEREGGTMGGTEDAAAPVPPHAPRTGERGSPADGGAVMMGSRPLRATRGIRR